MDVRHTTGNLGSPSIRLSGLKIWVHGRQFPEATDYWDGNWLHVTVECSAINAVVCVSGPLIHLSELAQWATSAEKLHSTLNGEANLVCMEPELSVKLVLDKLGHMLMTVNITPDLMSQQHCFRVELDQSYLPNLIAGCRGILDSYPIKGAPDKKR
jgi:hypothetical protein